MSTALSASSTRSRSFNQFKVIRALAHPVRLQILQALAEHPACVCELQAKTGCRQAYISQQLSTLRAAGLVCGEREGSQVHYRLTRPEVIKLLEIVQASAESLKSSQAGRLRQSL